MHSWRSLEKDFRSIPDPFGDLRADWSDQPDFPNCWRLAGGAIRDAGDHFMAIAKIAGNALVSDPALCHRLSDDVLAESDPSIRWLTAVRSMTRSFEIGPVHSIRNKDGAHIGHMLTGRVQRIIDASALLCLQLAAESSNVIGSQLPLAISIDDIDSFERIRVVHPDAVSDLLNSDGRLEVPEDTVKRLLEDILVAAQHQNDWGGEDCDLFTVNLILGGRRTPTAFVLKGCGTRAKQLRICDCGKNGDQLVRLMQVPAELFVIQYVGPIHENLFKDMEGKIGLRRAQGYRASYCAINGQDTARLLRAYKWM